jgi:hypothetical protein
MGESAFFVALRTISKMNRFLIIAVIIVLVSANCNTKNNPTDLPSIRHTYFYDSSKTNFENFKIGYVDTFTIHNQLYRIYIVDTMANTGVIQYWNKNEWKIFRSEFSIYNLDKKFDFTGDGIIDIAFHNLENIDIYPFQIGANNFSDTAMHFDYFCIVDSTKKIYCQSPLTVLALNSCELFAIHNNKPQYLYYFQASDYNKSNFPNKCYLYKCINGNENNGKLIDSFVPYEDRYGFKYEAYWKEVLKKHPL